tara:strand:+ start:147 stop:779 length:633 start_codon:yes stop_codon:yes gene_type:complete
MKKIYSAINSIQKELCKEGLAKSKKSAQQGYSFRGIDDVFNVLSPLLAQYGVCILPRVLNRLCVERQSARGGSLFYVTLEVEFDFVSSEDSSTHTIKTFGEAMDSGDKATNKAMSAAYKYAALQAFAIPTEGDNDPDATTHQVSPEKKEKEGSVKSFDNVNEPPKPFISDEQLAQAIKWVKTGVGTLKGIEKKYQLTSENKAHLASLNIN